MWPPCISHSAPTVNSKLIKILPLVFTIIAGIVALHYGILHSQSRWCRGWFEGKAQVVVQLFSRSHSFYVEAESRAECHVVVLCWIHMCSQPVSRQMADTCMTSFPIQ
jgi:hypothetical protein